MKCLKCGQKATEDIPLEYLDEAQAQGGKQTWSCGCISAFVEDFPDYWVDG